LGRLEKIESRKIGEMPGKSKIKKHNMSRRGHSQFRI
jgi:hypothetical protein